jgi:hypothetical protein
MKFPAQALKTADGKGREEQLMRYACVGLAAACLTLGGPARAQDSAQGPHSSPARLEAFARLPYWPGYWVGETGAGTGIGGMRQPDRAPADTPAEGGLAMWDNKAPWNEEGKRRVAEVRRTQAARKGLGWGFPLMMASSTPIQFLITPEEVLIVNAYKEARHIYTDGRDHPPADDLWPTVTGNSIGHWEGDTLVIDTIMVSDPNAFFQGNVPLSEQAHYRERIRMDGDRLVSEWTIEDPVTLSGPWKAKVYLVREPGFDRMIEVNWDNDRTGNDGTENTIEPPADQKHRK